MSTGPQLTCIPSMVGRGNSVRDSAPENKEVDAGRTPKFLAGGEKKLHSAYADVLQRIPKCRAWMRENVLKKV